MMPFRLLRPRGVTIFQQLQLEEQLYRHSKHNWLIVNRGTPAPTVVTGIGGKIESLVNISKAKETGTTVVRRYTGGGTVVVDANSFFVSFIGNFSDIGCGKGPRELMRWSEAVYQPVVEATLLPQAKQAGVTFRLLENDYVLGSRKCGGNAQGISRDRFVHHTSFLWDFTEEAMSLLTLPDKRPEYRANRGHSDFLCKLKDYITSLDAFEEAVIDTATVKLGTEHCTWASALELCEPGYAYSTRIEQL